MNIDIVVSKLTEERCCLLRHSESDQLCLLLDLWHFQHPYTEWEPSLNAEEGEALVCHVYRIKLSGSDCHV